MHGPAESPVTTRDLRQFGIVFGSAFGIVFGAVIPLIRRGHLVTWPWAVTIFFVLLALAVPEALRGFRSLWMKFGERLGAVQSKIVLTIVYYTVVTPLGWIRRLSGKPRRFDPDAATYRVPATPRAPRTLERPF
jgi:hypothetical protein